MHTMILITVEGSWGKIDLEVPGDIPISELLPALLEICGPQPLSTSLNNSSMWGLGQIGSLHPLPVTSSLIRAGLMDGGVLVLQTVKEWANQREYKTSGVLTSIQPERGRPGVIWNKDGLMS